MKDEKTTRTSFIANVGGLLGLCMGFSVVSIFEIMYHCGGAVNKKWKVSRNADKSATVNKSHVTIGSKFTDKDQKQPINDNLLTQEHDAKEAMPITIRTSI